MRSLLRLLVILMLAVYAVRAAVPGATALKSVPELKPLLPGSPRMGQTARPEWNRQRKELLRQWTTVIGGFPERKPPLKAEVLGTEELAEFRRQHVRYQVESGINTDGYLLTPKGAKGKLPAVVVFHATTPFGARGPAGLEAAYPEEKRQGVQLARAGYLVWCPRNFINTDGANYAGNAAALLKRHPNWTGMGRMTWDAIRAMDFLQSWPQADRKRIACLGHSLGAKEVLYAMAFDERYCAGVFSEGGIGLNFSNWDAPWYLGPQIHQPGFGLDHHQLLALIAPRPFLLIAGDSADDNRSKAFVDAARPIYELSGAGEKLQFFHHHKGHVYDAEVREAAEKFLGQALRFDRKADPVPRRSSP